MQHRGGGGAYDLIPMTEDGRQLHERDKRELLKIEELKLGSGPLAAWGRKISADIEVRHTDGTVAYRSPMFVSTGFHGSVFIHNASKEAGTLSFGQTGIWSGINGWQSEVNGALSFSPSSSLAGCWSMDARIMTVLVFVKKS